MALPPPVTIKIQADATEFHETIADVKKALSSLRPSDYQIRLDALKLTVQMDSGREMTTGQFAEWQQFFEASLLQALE